MEWIQIKCLPSSSVEAWEEAELLLRSGCEKCYFLVKILIAV